MLWTTDATVCRHDQRGMPCFITDIFGVYLIERNRILYGPCPFVIGSRQILICIGMTMHALLTAGWERPAYTVTPLRRGSKTSSTLVNSKSFSAMGEPTPILQAGSSEGNTHSIRCICLRNRFGVLAEIVLLNQRIRTTAAPRARPALCKKGSASQRVWFVVGIHPPFLVKKINQ